MAQAVKTSVLFVCCLVLFLSMDVLALTTRKSVSRSALSRRSKLRVSAKVRGDLEDAWEARLIPDCGDIAPFDQSMCQCYRTPTGSCQWHTARGCVENPWSDDNPQPEEPFSTPLCSAASIFGVDIPSSDLYQKVKRDMRRYLKTNVDNRSPTPPHRVATTGQVVSARIGRIRRIIDFQMSVLLNARKQILYQTFEWHHDSCAASIFSANLVMLNRALEAEERHVYIYFVYDGMKIRLDTTKTDPLERHGLPHSRTVPRIRFHALPLHNKILGSIHGKYMVVDQTELLVVSANVQDEPFLEMGTHYRGDIVKSFVSEFWYEWRRGHPTASWLAEGSDIADIVPLDVSIGARHTAVTIEDEESSESDIPTPRTPSPRNVETMFECDPSLMKKKKTKTHYPFGFGFTHGFEAFRRVLFYQGKTDYTLTSCPSDFKMTSRCRSLALSNAPGSLKTLQNEEWDFLDVQFPDVGTQVPMMALTKRSSGGLPMGFLASLFGKVVSSSSLPTAENAVTSAIVSLLGAAKESIFIQTPNLNADKAVQAIADALDRNIDVTVITPEGFNDFMQKYMLQGGTNKHIGQKLVNSINGHKLRFCWYKPQSKYANLPEKSHLKFLVVDKKVTILGSTNMDTQSFYHSQEVNVLVDDANFATTMLQSLFILETDETCLEAEEDLSNWLVFEGDFTLDEYDKQEEEDPDWGWFWGSRDDDVNSLIM
eukprot:GILJ01000902.1.p1 GENE.GILJ01000902.1~~GILJ01000902.1.p1  ORF type:complete len:725 (-),score=84.60 GILJ01000902.1:64-2196(-)